MNQDIIGREYITNPMGHEWETYEDGTVNSCASTRGHHNGPVCVKCGYTFCEHCKKEPMKPCTAINLPEELLYIEKHFSEIDSKVLYTRLVNCGLLEYIGEE